MLIIYNLSGLLLGLLGVLLGLVGMMVSGSVGFGAFTLALTWLIGGVWWRTRPQDNGLKRPYPALFFIPLPFLAGLLIPLSGLVFLVERGGKARESDPRVVSLRDDVKTLRESIHGGDTLFSNTLHTALRDQADTLPDVTDAHVFSRFRDGKVLVMLMTPDLKEIDIASRRKLLDAIETALKNEPKSQGQAPYIALRGKYAFGALHIPPDFTKIDTLVPDEPLLPFYGSSETKASPNAATEPVKDQPSPPSEEKKAAPDRIAEALESLRSAERSERWTALQRLAGAPVDESRKAEVVPLLLAEYDASDSVGLVYVLPAMSRWMTKDEALQALSRRIDDPNNQVAQSVIRALGETKDPRAVAILAEKLPGGRNDYAVDHAIESLGTIAIPDVLEFTKNSDAAIRKRAYKILGRIGDETTLAALKDAAPQESDDAARGEAERAVKALERRLKR